MKKIGCVTFHASHNYGSVLQAYALQTYIKNNFKDVDYKIINLRLPAQHAKYDFPKKKTSFKNKILQFLNYKSLKSKYNKFEFFINNILDVTKEYSSEKDIDEVFDIYLSGGDQIWNPKCKDFSWLYYLDYVKHGIKVSYAPSMGPGPVFSEEQKRHIQKCLASYKLIGVREQGTKNEVEKLLENDLKPIKIFPDPALLLSKTDWEKLLDSQNVTTQDNSFILFYSLYCSDKTYKYVKRVGKLLKKHVIVTKYLKHCDYFHYYKNCFDTGPLDFLNYIRTSDLIVATSFHACVFSAIFHKPFIAIDVENDNRIQGFFDEYHLKNHNLKSNIATDDEIIEKAKLKDFDFFDSELKRRKNDVYAFFNDIITNNPIGDGK